MKNIFQAGDISRSYDYDLPPMMLAMTKLTRAKARTATARPMRP